MTVDELVVKLHELQAAGKGGLPVVLADWNEEYLSPSELGSIYDCSSDYVDSLRSRQAGMVVVLDV